MNRNIKLCVLIVLMAVGMLCMGCAPSTFVKGQVSGWKVIELNDSVKGNYDAAWMKTVDTIARNYDIEMLDKDSGYLRTTWAYGISGGVFNRYRGRITVKYSEVKDPEKVELKTEAQWLRDTRYGVWTIGWDRNFQRDVFTALSGRLGRTVSVD